MTAKNVSFNTTEGCQKLRPRSRSLGLSLGRGRVFALSTLEPWK